MHERALLRPQGAPADVVGDGPGVVGRPALTYEDAGESHCRSPVVVAAYVYALPVSKEPTDAVELTHEDRRIELPEARNEPCAQHLGGDLVHLHVERAAFDGEIPPEVDLLRAQPRVQRLVG